MTRKDYAVIAEALASVKPKSTEALVTTVPDEWRGRLYQWHDTLAALRDALQADNPRFDRSRFIAAAKGL